MHAFVSTHCVEPIHRNSEHGGTGPINFRRLLKGSDFASSIDFVDYSSIPPGSTIGRHDHFGTEELYYVVAGTPIVGVDGVHRRLEPGDVAVVRSGQWHELINDTDQTVTIFVVQARA